MILEMNLMKVGNGKNVELENSKEKKERVEQKGVINVLIMGIMMDMDVKENIKDFGIKNITAMGSSKREAERVAADNFLKLYNRRVHMIIYHPFRTLLETP